MGELHHLERFRHAPLGLIARHARHLQPIGDIVRDRHMRKHGIGLEHHVGRALVGRRQRHVLAADDDLAPGRRLEARDHAQQRGLAAARRPEQREELVLGDVEGDIVDGRRRRREMSW